MSILLRHARLSIRRRVNGRRLVPLYILCAGVLSVIAYAPVSTSQPYPSRPVRLVIPYPAGGPTDFSARPVAQKLSQLLGQQVVADNRPGAGAVLGSELVARAAADGHTLLFGTGGGTFMAPLMLPKVPYDPLRDFAPVSMVVMGPQVLVTHPSVAANSVGELVALAKARPGVLNFASAGSGTIQHLGGELLQSLTGTKMVHVPYRGTAQATTDLISGQVQFMFSSAPTVIPHVKTGKLRLLATGAARRSALNPDTATVSESVPGFELATWYGIFAPAHTPDAVIKRLHTEIVKVVADPELRDRLIALGLEPVSMTPQELKRYVELELSRWSRIIKSAGIKVQQ
jgi:tripartite-type tricarboxylate transporter receptor subunit TctC